MPYRRGRRRKRKSYRKKTPSYKQGLSGVVKTVGKNLPAMWRALNWVYAAINPELKYIDSGVVTVSASSTPTVTGISLIAQGDDVTNREGRSILARSLFLRLSMTKHASATITMVRVVIVIDMRNAGASFASTDLLVSNDVNSQLNVNAGGRFRVLIDKVLSLDTDDVVQHREIFRNLGFHIRYSGTAGDVTTAWQNAMFIMIFSNEATNTPQVTYNTRIRFIDN